MANTTIRENWNPKLQHGENGEADVLEMLHKLYPRAFKIQGNFKFFDIAVPELDGLRIEAKRDWKRHITKNFVFEFRNRGKKSGIAISLAHVWTQADRDKIYFMHLPELKDWLRTNWGWLKSTGCIVRGGDDMQSEMVKVRASTVTSQSWVCPQVIGKPNIATLQLFLWEAQKRLPAAESAVK